jgi:glycosyltransferase involved in cell wall biosynthesis
MDPYDRLRIAMVLYSAKLTGARRQKIRLANALARRGHDVELVFVRARGALSKAIAPEIRVVELGGPVVGAAASLRLGSLPGMVAALPALVRHLRRTRPDVLIAGNSPAALLCGPAHRLARTPGTRCVLCVTNHLTGTGDGRAWIEQAVARRVLPWAEAIVPVGEAVRRDLAEHVPGVRGRLHAIHNPILPEDWERRRDAPAPHPWFEDGGPPVLVGCGRLEPQKNFATLLRAMALVRARREVRLVLIGDGPQAGALRELARQLGIAQAVVFLGRISNPFAAMGRADLLVLSSRWEGLPNVLIEAMACGCPVVSTDAPGGSREALLDGALGPLVPPRDPAALAEAIVHSLEKPPARAPLEARGAEFGEARSVASWEVLLRELCTPRLDPTKARPPAATKAELPWA